MEPETILTRLAAMRRALAISHQEDVWRRLSGLDLGVGDVREALRGEESDGFELDRCPSLRRGGDPGARCAGRGAGATVHAIGARGPAHGSR